MRALAFSQRFELIGGRRVRAAAFEERSTLAVSAACVVANSLRDALSAAFASPVELRLFEASVPTQHGWQAIAREAIVYAAPGIALILRTKDAQAFARAAFGELDAPTRALSAMENAVLDRIIATFGSACSSLLGGAQPKFRRVAGAECCSTYFEIQVESPARFRVGIALETDPAMPPRAPLGIEALRDVPLELSVRSAPTIMLAADVAALELGSFVPMTVTKGTGFTLSLAGRPLASGECGVSGDRFAYAIERLHHAEGSYAPST